MKLLRQSSALSDNLTFDDPKPGLYLPPLPCTATAFLCFSDRFCQTQLWHFTATEGRSVARTYSPATPPEGTAHGCNPVLGPALLMWHSRHLVASPNVRDASSIVSSHAYIGEVKVFVDTVGETPVVCGKSVLSSPLTTSQEDCWWWWMQDGLSAEEDRRWHETWNSMSIWLYRLFSGMSGLAWHIVNKISIKIPW